MLFVLTTTESTDIPNLVEQLDGLDVKSTGITQDDLKILINVITDTQSKLKQNVRIHIAKNYLYFKGSVPTESIVAILANIRVKTNTSDAILSINLQKILIDWIISIYSFLEESDILERLYGIVFNYLEFDYLRSKISHLLFLSTKKKHINPKRVNRLLNIYHKYEFNEELIGLLLLYQQYAPNQIFDTFPKISEKIFLNPNQSYLDSVISLNSKITNDQSLYIKEFERRLKRRKKSHEIDYFSSNDSLDLQSLKQLSKNLNFNNNLNFSVLLTNGNYKLLFYILKEDHASSNKLNNFFELMFEDLLNFSKDEQFNFLNSVKLYIEASLNFPNSIIKGFLLSNLIILENYNDFTFFYLKNFPSINHVELIRVLKNFEKLSKKASIFWYASYIDSLSYLIKNWCSNISDIFIQDLLTCLDFLIKSLSIQLKKINYNRLLLIPMTKLIRSIQDIPIKYLSITHVVLPKSLIYPLLFISDSISFSEICAHLNFAKQVLKIAESNDEVTQLTDLHNSYVVDICNLSWRNKAFDTSKNNTAFNLPYEFINSLQNNLSIFDKNSSFKSIFNIHSSPCFAGYSSNFLKTIENNNKNINIKHDGPLTQQSVQSLKDDPESIWLDESYEELRIHILKELESLGYTGISELLFTHLKSLVNR